METQFIGENLLPGKLGYFFIILSFIASLFSAFAYFRSANTEGSDLEGSRSWLKMARGSFIIHTVSVLGIFTALYYIISNHLFEYNYAYAHSSKALPMEYLLSCFWEGSEGSFMLWAFWNSMLGLVVMARGKKLESRAMSIIALVQVAIATTLLGLYFGDTINIGSSPFILLRDKMQAAPIFADPDYLSKYIQDGNGLNVSLQNYWMVIHPPVLFLGFASTLIPFAYCIAALWKGDYQLFVKPTLAWSLFSGGVLGLGIMMGGAWAYESLNFGGYWAWDPVENASLVPWLTLVAGLHTLLIYKATKRSIIFTFILLLLTHLLIWYSTFLTRTGILGDTSVHAFTGEGSSLTYHLLAIIGVLLLISIGLMWKRWKAMPRIKKEEEASSREFWMFIGSFVLLLSAIQISISTSIPVWAPLAKWITGKDVAPPVEPVQHYNSIQIWVVIVVALLSATILYFKFVKTSVKAAFRSLLVTFIISAAFTALVGITQKIELGPYFLLLFASCYAIVANLYYAFAIQKARLKLIGAPIAHLGFGLMLLGILLSSYNKEVISWNTTGESIGLKGKDMKQTLKENRENIMMFKDVPVAMADYMATFKGDSTSETDPRLFYRVDYERIDTTTNEVVERFTLYPDLIKPKNSESFTANPASKHYLTRDIFTYINQASNSKLKGAYTKYTVHKGDSIFLTGGYMVFNGFIPNAQNEKYVPVQGDVSVAANLSIFNMKGKVKDIAPIYYIRDQREYSVEDTFAVMNMQTRFSKILPDEGAAEIEIRQETPDFIVLKAMVFPYINVLWLGVVVMVIGFLISMFYRNSQKEAKTRSAE